MCQLGVAGLYREPLHPDRGVRATAGPHRSLPVVVLPGWRPASYPCRVASNAETSKVVRAARKTKASGRITTPRHPFLTTRRPPRTNGSPTGRDRSARLGGSAFRFPANRG